MQTALKIDRDLINMAGTKEVSQGIVLIADVVQQLPLHVRVLAAAGFFALLLERVGIPPQDPMTILGNLRDEAEREGRVEFRAIEQYFKDDLALKGPNG